MILYIEISKFQYREAEIRSIDGGNKVLIQFKDNEEAIEVYNPTIDIRTSHVGIEGYVREGATFDFKQKTYDCYPTKPRSK